MLARAARRPAQWRTTRTQTAHPSTTQVKMPHTTCALATCRPPENCAPYPSARSTPRVSAGNPATSANRLSWSRRSSGGKSWKTWPKRRALSSRNCSRYNAAAMNAKAISASPKALSATCRTNHALRATAASAPGVSPLKMARPTSPVASGAAKNETAEPRSSRSLASCNNTRQSASIESAGPRPTGVSCETATTWTAAPAHGSAIVSARGRARKPINGASASAVANPYSARATRCRVRITAGTSRAHARGGPGRLSGGHLLDQSYRQTAVQPGVHDLDQQAGGGVLTRVHDQQDGAHLFRGRSLIALRRMDDLEDITGSDAVAAPLIDEEVLLRAGDGMRIAPLQQLRSHALLYRRGPHLTRVAERLERHREVTVVNAAVLGDDFGEHLLILDRRDARDTERDDDVAPPAELQRAIDAGQQERIADMIRRVPRRLDRDFLERRRRRAIGETGNGRRGGRAQHVAPWQPLVFAQETRGVELARAQRMVGLVRVGTEHILDHLLIRAAAIKNRLVALVHGGRRRRLDGQERCIRRNRIDGHGIERHDRCDRVARRGTDGVGGRRRGILAHSDRVPTLGEVRHLREIQDLTGIDPVRVFDDGGIEAVDLRPQERVVEIHLRDGPEGLTARNGMTGGDLALKSGGRLRGVLLLNHLRCVLRRQDAPHQRQRRQGQ